MAYPYRDWDFEGCDKLHRMSASWFVSYCYHEHLDWRERHWERSASAGSRRRVYETTREHHAYWLGKVRCMEPKYLGRNKIGLSGHEVVKMATRLLQPRALERTAPDPYAGEAGRQTLRRLGEAWFVSYMYYDKLDRGHLNWTRGTRRFSVSTYEATRHRHHDWLELIAYDRPDGLANAALGLSEPEVVGLAMLLLGQGF